MLWNGEFLPFVIAIGLLLRYDKYYEVILYGKNYELYH